jgi:hypothetical protein
MKIVLKMEGDLYDDIMEHLLPADGEQEQAAFLFAGSSMDDQVLFEVIEAQKLRPTDFVQQQSDYLELADGTRAGLIKRAHDLGTSLIEMHSHPGPWPAGFSYADRLGLEETVPHMWWRLEKRPYMAIVVANSGFDALVWLDNANKPRALDALLAGDATLKPTNLSLGGWE